MLVLLWQLYIAVVLLMAPAPPPALASPLSLPPLRTSPLTPMLSSQASDTGSSLYST